MVLQQQYTNDSTIKTCIDKYRVREYVKSKGVEEILVNLLGVYDSEEDIDWDKLPNRFAIKCTHGSGYNIIVSDYQKEKQDVEIINKWKKKLHKWLHEDYAIFSGEVIYRHIPRKIIIEEFIGSEEGKWPVDYKFYCSYGKIFAVFCVTDREEYSKYELTDANNNVLPYLQTNNVTRIEKPMCYNRLKEVASILSEDFPFVRVDLYERNEKIYFGELTFAPNGCIDTDYNLEGQRFFGAAVCLNK